MGGRGGNSGARERQIRESARRLNPNLTPEQEQEFVDGMLGIGRNIAESRQERKDRIDRAVAIDNSNNNSLLQGDRDEAISIISNRNNMLRRQSVNNQIMMDNAARETNWAEYNRLGHQQEVINARIVNNENTLNALRR